MSRTAFREGMEPGTGLVHYAGDAAAAQAAGRPAWGSRNAVGAIGAGSHRQGPHGCGRKDTSGLSVLNCRVEVLELDAGILGGEPPVHAAAGRVAGRLPGGDLPL